MRLQNLAIIFIVILIPLLLVLSYYLEQQQDTLALQAEYDLKLAESTREAIKAFEINTVEWANNKKNSRANANDIINAFTTSLANSLRINGTAKEYMLDYMPATVVAMYDGYYIYSPAYTLVSLENEDGVQLFYNEEREEITTKPEEPNYKKNQVIYIKDGVDSIEDITKYNTATMTTKPLEAKKEYRHVLYNQVSYTEPYTQGDFNVIINYTLDNKISVYGTYNNKIVDKEGYLVYFEDRISMQKENEKISIKYNGTNIQPETLSEQILYNEGGEYKLGTFKYIYNTENSKVYYDDKQERFFKLKSEDKARAWLKEGSAGEPGIEYKSVSILTSSDNSKYKKVYQVLNGTDNGKWYEYDGSSYKEIQSNTETSLGLNNIEAYEDCSAINYYVEAYAFTNWVNDNLRDIDYLKISENNNPEDKTSAFSQHKRGIMIKSINSNLNVAISNYNKNSTEYDFRLPVLTDTDWDQIFENISIITFFQGLPIGLKYYNNYAIATSNANREFVDPDEIYFSGTGDSNFHRAYCEHCIGSNYVGYRSVEYVQKEYTTNGTTYYYYSHDNNDQNDRNSETACYYCIVNRANYEKMMETDDIYKQQKAYLEALGRERYYQKLSYSIR